MTLKQWRRKYRLTLSTVAYDLGCSIAMVSYIEAGKRAPSMDMAAKLVKLAKGEIGYSDLPKRSAA